MSLRNAWLSDGPRVLSWKRLFMMKLPLTSTSFGVGVRLSPEEEIRMRVIEQRFGEMLSDECDGLVFELLVVPRAKGIS